MGGLERKGEIIKRVVQSTQSEYEEQIYELMAT